MDSTFHAIPNPTSEPAQLLLVDDDPVMIRVLAKMLGGVGDLRFALTGDDAIRLARESVPDLILLDAELPDQTGFDVCAVLKQDPLFRDVPIIFVTSHRNQEDELRGFAAGAADFIGKPVSEPILRARVGTHLRMQRLTSELRHLSTTDALTRVANRHRFDQLLEAECNRASRGAPLALLMVDVDDFKGFNDSYGHPAGDACLQSVAAALTSACPRAGDVVARVGGEEFAVVLPATTLEGATIVARRAGRLVRELDITHARSSCAPVVTVSIGVAGFSEPGVEAGEPALSARERASEHARVHCETMMRQAADEALYEAKRAGRNRVWMKDLSDPTRRAVPTTAPANCDGEPGSLERTRDDTRAA